MDFTKELEGIVGKFGTLVVFDVETSGLDFKRDKIIEYASVKFTAVDGKLLTSNRKFLIKFDGKLSAEVTAVTGLTDEILKSGMEREEAEEIILNDLFGQNCLIAAYNAQFDLNFVKNINSRPRLCACDYVDVMAIFRDRAPYPHKLANAAQRYGVSLKNAHDALSDATATAEVLAAMARERGDVEKYVNLFGYNPRYGVNGARLEGVEYRPQYYNATRPLYA